MSSKDVRQPMRADAKEKWVTYLRSGMFEQVTGQLTDGWDEEAQRPKEACCLGVLTQVAIDSGLETVRWCPTDPNRAAEWFDEESWERDQELAAKNLWPHEHGPDREDYWNNETNGVLPPPVALWAFDTSSVHTFDLTNPVLTPNDYLREDDLDHRTHRGVYRAAELNDDVKASFEEIADIVEEMPVKGGAQ